MCLSTLLPMGGNRHLAKKELEAVGFEIDWNKVMRS